MIENLVGYNTIDKLAVYGARGVYQYIYISL